jgi:hypothetical protein
VDAAKRERIIVARYEWRAAEIAYTAEADKYFGDGFPDNDEITQPAEGLTTTAWGRLWRLRDAADAARSAYWDAVNSSQPCLDLLVERCGCFDARS